MVIPAAVLGGGAFLLAGRHAGAQRGRAGRALGGRHHRVLRRAVLRLPAPRTRAPRPGYDGPARRVRAAWASPTPSARRAGAFAIRDLSFEVRPGETFGVIGPNGSGKTTLLRLLSRVVAPASRRIRLDGADVARLSGAAAGPPGRGGAAGRAARFPAHGRGAGAHGPLPARARAASSRARRIAPPPGAPWRPRACSSSGETLLDRLSGGERQRVMLARALAQEPRLLVLDEPTAHLDLRYQAECAGLLRRLEREAGLTIVLVSHDLDFAAELCDRLLLHGRRRGGAGGPARVRASTRRCSSPPTAAASWSTSTRSAAARPSTSCTRQAETETGGDDSQSAVNTANRSQIKGSRSRPMSRPKPARSRHCKWGVSPDPAMGATGPPERAPGKAGPRRRSTSQETWLRSPMPTPFEAKGVVDATASIVWLLVAGPAGAAWRRMRRRRRRVDPVVVTATPVETPAEQLGASVTVINGEDFETYHYPTVDEALRNVPGVEIRRSGSYGKTTSITHPRRQRQPGAGAGGRRAGEEPDARPGRPVRHLART